VSLSRAGDAPRGRSAVRSQTRRPCTARRPCDPPGVLTRATLGLAILLAAAALTGCSEEERSRCRRGRGDPGARPYSHALPRGRAAPANLDRVVAGLIHVLRQYPERVVQGGEADRTRPPARRSRVQGRRRPAALRAPAVCRPRARRRASSDLLKAGPWPPHGLASAVASPVESVDRSVSSGRVRGRGGIGLALWMARVWGAVRRLPAPSTTISTEPAVPNQRQAAGRSLGRSVR